MWAWWWPGALGGWAAAAAAALALLFCRRRLTRKTTCGLDQVHMIKVVAAPVRPRVCVPYSHIYRPSVTLVTTVHQGGSPSDPAPSPPPTPNDPNDPINNQPSTSSDSSRNSSTSTEYKSLPKLPLPEQWLHKRPFDYKYGSTIPRPLVQIVHADLGSELTPEHRTKKFSVTRSPSLEKDDKSPFLSSAKFEKSDVFGFDAEAVKKVESGQDIPVDKEMSDELPAMSPKESSSDRLQDMSPSNLRRFRSVSTRLDMCSVNENSHLDNHQERLEMQNSPRVVECSSAKEKSNSCKFDFSPKLLADSLTSPRFFTPPEMISPMFFAEPSPKSVYYDTVRSPKFFPETPRTDNNVPQSPRALSDHQNRNKGHVEKPNSPRLLNANASKPKSPKVYSYNKENYFTFDNVHAGEEGASRLSPRPKRYLGRNSIERERFTPPAEKEVRKYRRHHSCDTNYKNIELNSITDNNNAEIVPKPTEETLNNTDVDVVDCCVKIDSIQIETEMENENRGRLAPSHSNSAQLRRQRLKSISLDSDNAKIIEQNLGLPIAKQMKDQLNEAYKNQEVSTSCESIDRYPKSPKSERPIFKFEEENKDKTTEEEEPKSPDTKHKKSLRHSSDTQSFIDMPRFSPKEFEITVTSEEGDTTAAEVQSKRKGSKNLRNLTIDLTKRDSDLEKELLEFEKLYTDAEEKKVKTPTLKVKATSLDSSESVILSLPQKKTLDVPQNSISVPNTPKRQLKRILQQKSTGGKMGFNLGNADQRRLYLKGQDSGIFLRENHAHLMLYQPASSRMGSRTMGSFDENMADLPDNKPEINVSAYHLEPTQTLGSNLLNYKQNLSVSSTNLKTLPEGVPSDDFEPNSEEEKFGKKLHRRNSNQSLMLSHDGKYSSHSLQSSNCSLSSAGASCHNLASVRTSVSNFSLNTDNRQKKMTLERRDSNASMMVNTEHLAPATRVICSSNVSLSGETTQSKNCLLQRRGSNNSLTLNITNNLSRHSSNTSLNKDAKPGQKKGLLERRSSNTSLTLNINNSNPQLSVNKGLSISNYNLNGSTCNLSRYNSNQSIDNPVAEHKKGILERRSSNTSLTLNISNQEPRDIEIDESLIDPNLKEFPKHRKSLSTENLIPKSYKTRIRSTTDHKCVGFGSHDNLWSTSYNLEQEDCPQNLTYICGDHENEIIYAFGHQDDPNFAQGFTRSITTKPLSPQSTSEDFRLYLANMQHLQNASSVLSRQQLRDLNDVFQNGYSKVKCSSGEGQHCCTGIVKESDLVKENPQMEIPESVLQQPCSEYQKKLLRNLHQEFWDMPTNFQEKPIVSGSNPKNRYKTILPNEHSRFILKAEEGSTMEGYINANYIKGHEYTKNSYIATQGPLQNTIYDFWRMVYQNYCTHRGDNQQCVQKVVMLTNFIENNRQKCEKYFPLELDEEVTFHSPAHCDVTSFFEETTPDEPQNSFTIKNSGVINKAGYTIRKLNVTFNNNYKSGSVSSENYQNDSASNQNDSVTPQNDKAKRDTSEATVYHYWFHNWADHKCPKDVNALLNLSLDVLKDSKYDFNQRTDVVDEHCKCTGSPQPGSKFVFPPLDAQNSPCNVQINVSTPLDFSTESLSPPTIVHCSAGIGRTGCLIAILNGIKQLSNECKVDVLGIVCNMRLNRGGMVQNSEQYELIHKVLCLFEQACLPGL